MKQLLRSFSLLMLTTSLLSSQKSLAQLVGTENFLQGNYVEVGIATNGAFGTGGDAPAGYHARGGAGAPTKLGFVSDPDKDGWGVGVPDYIGDYFLPGTPQEGWDIQYEDVWAKAWRGSGATSMTGGLTGSCTGYAVSGDRKISTWEGKVGDLTIRQVTTLRMDRLYFVTKVTIKNVGTVPVNKIYYERTVDPDNEVAISDPEDAGGYTTVNKIEYYLPNEKMRSLVSGTGQRYNSYLGLGTKDCRAKPYISKTGLTPADSLSVMFRENAKESARAIFRFDAPDTAMIQDAGVGLIFNLGSLAPGDSTNISYAYVLSLADLDSAFADVSPVWEYDGAQYESGDTVKVCREKDAADQLKKLNIFGGSGYEWTWRARPGLKNLSGTENESVLSNTMITYVAKPSEAFGCIDSMVITVQPFVNPDPPSVTSPVSYCRYGSAVPLEARGMPGAVMKYYTTASGGTSVARLVPNTNAAGTYIFYASQINGICESARTPIVVTVNPIPNLVDFTVSHPTICGGRDGWIQFRADMPGEVYSVFYDMDGAPQPTLTLTSDIDGFIKIPNLMRGSYTAIYIVNKFGCISTTYFGPLELEGPFATPPIISNNGPICAGEIALLMTTPRDSTTYMWRGPGGYTSTLPNPSFVATSASGGTYSLVTVKNACASKPATMTFVIFPDPKNPNLPDQAICEGSDLVVAFAEEANTEYMWTGDGDGFVHHSGSFTRTEAKTDYAGQYILTASNERGCKMSDTINVAIDPLVTLMHSADTSICSADSISLFVHTNATNVIWSPAAGMNDSGSKNPRVNPSQTTTYTVIAQSDHNACPDTSGKVTVSVIPTPKVSGYDTLVRMNIPYMIMPVFGPEVTKWKWSPSDSLSCSDCPNPTFNSSKDMTYLVYGTDQTGCAGVDTVTIRVFCDGANVTMPNAFTPNGDGNNDIYYVRGTGFTVKSFSIYNRLGQLVFSKENFLPNDPQYGWDGRFGGQDISDAAGFVYMLEVICYNSGYEPTLLKGSVLMIK